MPWIRMYCTRVNHLDFPLPWLKWRADCGTRTRVIRPKTTLVSKPPQFKQRLFSYVNTLTVGNDINLIKHWNLTSKKAIVIYLDMSLMLYSIAAFAAALGLYRLLQVGKRDPRMPKGPPTLPILGNFHQIPSSGLYRQFVKFPIMKSVPNLKYPDSEYGQKSTALFSPWNSGPQILLFSVIEKQFMSFLTRRVAFILTGQTPMLGSC